MDEPFLPHQAPASAKGASRGRMVLKGGRQPLLCLLVPAPASDVPVGITAALAAEGIRPCTAASDASQFLVRPVQEAGADDGGLERVAVHGVGGVRAGEVVDALEPVRERAHAQ